jgi:protease-4
MAMAVVTFIFGGLFLVFFGFLLLAYAAVKGESPRLAGGPRIGVVEIKGGIGMGGGRGSVEADDVLKHLRRLRDDEDLKAVVVRVDSPGGAVAPSQEIFEEIKKLGEKKAVVCSMGNVAASGGLYVALGCEKILAQPGTITGSIGVVSQFTNLTGVAEKLHFKVETVKSGKLKDAGNPFREMSPEVRAYYQALIDAVYQQFLKAVVESRELPEEKVRPVADGRVLTGEQALELGLIDQLGTFNDAIEVAKKEAGLKGEPRLVYPPSNRDELLDNLLGGVVGALADAVRGEIKREVTPGVGLYYLAP